MKKNTIKAFTLVEMLIVIVIIGILIASLMPRMQAAQGRARDVARKNDLAQIQTAIISSQSDRRDWPEINGNARS
jgi:prepilin-type N-terminal cleavage/methylation domain-containing protein